MNKCSTPDEERPVERFTAHLINHTHWDREWFLTSVYTNQWIAGLIDRLEELVEKNPGFRFWLDGQTLVISDLLDSAPHYRETVKRLVRAGNLLIGPYYCQPDWRLTCGESLFRNILYGLQDVSRYDGTGDAGWLVDTFGHISQSPQLHRLFGIDSVYIWRGVPHLAPYFSWLGPDGSRLFTIFLFGGYRNLYGVSHAPELSIKRMQAEIDKLRRVYPTPDIPLFDGYDLEDNPEDPWRFFQDLIGELPAEIDLQESDPPSFAREMRSKVKELPTISGELLSGKYGAVFPGTLSARTYLKIMNRDCENLLYQVCEPLAALARLKGKPYQAAQYEGWSRSLLQNAVHDCICGVSIDLVHEKMEFTYRQLFQDMQADMDKSLEYILADFPPGIYAVSTNPFPYQGWQLAGGQLFHVQTQGVGVWKVSERHPLEQTEMPADSFSWINPFYEATVHADGRVQVEEAMLGALSVSAEHGDAYSSESGRFLGTLKPAGPLWIEAESPYLARLRLDCSAAWEGVKVSATVRLLFDRSPLIRWQIDLDTRGTDFRVDMVFEMGLAGQIYAGMPFDTVERMPFDEDNLPRQLDDHLATVLVGQRELGTIKTFPFQGYLVLSDGKTSAALFAKGLNAYQANAGGGFTIPMTRAVEWLTKPDLEHRIGDAGPSFYVPDARGERKVTHELAVAFLEGSPDDPAFHALHAGFQNPALIVESHASTGQHDWKVFQENLPLSSLQVAGEHLVARFYNPTHKPIRLSRDYAYIDPSGAPGPIHDLIPPKAIVTLVVAELPTTDATQKRQSMRVLNRPYWRVGPNQGLPDPTIILLSKERIHHLDQRIAEISEKLSRVVGADRYRWQHQLYMLQREKLEYHLSTRQNEIKLAHQGWVTREYLFVPDQEIAEIGRQLNQLRIKRRIYDYIVQVI
jgi:alpha-mannosidase